MPPPQRRFVVEHVTHERKVKPKWKRKTTYNVTFALFSSDVRSASFVILVHELFTTQLRPETFDCRLQQSVSKFHCWRKSGWAQFERKWWSDFLIVSLGFLTWLYFCLTQLALMLSPCCASCYFCYYKKFLTDDEKLAAWLMSRDCRCEYEDPDMNETSALASHGPDQPQQDW